MWTIVDLILAHSLRRWPIIKLTMDQNPSLIRFNFLHYYNRDMRDRSPILICIWAVNISKVKSLLFFQEHHNYNVVSAYSQLHFPIFQWFSTNLFYWMNEGGLLHIQAKLGILGLTRRLVIKAVHIVHKTVCICCIIKILKANCSRYCYRILKELRYLAIRQLGRV